MSGGDGAVVINTQLDSSGVDKGFDELKGKVIDIRDKLKSAGDTIDKSVNVPLTEMGKAGSDSTDKIGKGLDNVKGKAATTGQSFADMGKKLEEVSSKMQSAGEGMSKAITVPLAAMGAMGIMAAKNINESQSTVQATLGVTADKAKELTGTAKNIYEGGFGGSLGEVTDALLKVKQNIGEVNDADLQKITTSSLTLAKTFGADVNEVTRGGANLMRGFGIDATKAYDLMAYGAQNGLNFSNEMFDNLSEYSPLFSKMGFSADEYFQLLVKGSKAGVYNLDYINDVMKEFQIRTKDGSSTTQQAMEQLSGSTQKVWQDFLQGKGTVKDVSNAVLGELSGMNDQTKANQIGVALYGTHWEDMEAKAMYALGGVNGAIQGVDGSMQKMNDVTSIGQQFEAFSRQAMDAFAPLGEILLNFGIAILPPIKDGIKFLSDTFAALSPSMQNVIVAFGIFIAAIGPAIVIIASLIESFGVVITFVGGLSTSLGFLGTAFAFIVSPVGIVIAIIAALVAILIYVWNTNEGFRNAIIGAWNWIVQTAQVIWNYLYNGIIKPVFDQVYSFIMEIVGRIKDIWNKHGAEITAAANWAWNFIKSVVIGNLQTVWSFIQNAMQIIQGIFQIVWPIITGVIRIAWEYIKMVVRNGMDIISGIIDAVSKAIHGDWQGAWNSILDIFKNIWNNMKDFLHGIDLASIGKNIIQGLINGIKSMGSGVLGAVTGIAGSIKDSFMNAFKIHSPSRWMEAMIGVNMMLGWQNGIDGQKSDTIDKAREMTSWMMPQAPDLRNSAQTLTAASQPVNNNVVVMNNPTGDPNATNTPESNNQVPTTIEIPVVVDGREVARATMPFMDAELRNKRDSLNRARGG